VDRQYDLVIVRLADQARKNVERSGQVDAAQVVGTEGLPLGAVVRQQAQQLGNAEAGSVPGDQRVQAIPAGSIAAGTGDGQDRGMGLRPGPT
jgi:hypothetical protein